MTSGKLWAYEGTIAPRKHYGKNEGVHSIMIEINRNLYMDNSNVNYNKVRELNQLLSKLFLKKSREKETEAGEAYGQKESFIK